MGRLSIKAYIKAKPTRAQLKAEKQVQQGKERALKARLKGMIQQAKSQIKGLENAGLNTPALQKLKSKTDLKTKGKSYNELQSTYFAIDKFLKSMTSNVKGATRALEKTAEIIGMKGSTPSQIAQHAKEFFEIVSKAEQALQVSGISIGSPNVQIIVRELNQRNDAVWRNAKTIEDKVSAVLKEIDKSQTIQQEDEFGLYLYDTIGVRD